MTTSSLIILADRGGLKAYSVMETPMRVEFAFGGRVSNHRNGAASRRSMWNQVDGMFLIAIGWGWRAETNTGSARQLAERIEEVVKTERVDGWSFAAEPPIHKVVVDLLPVAIRGGSSSTSLPI